VLNRNTTRGAMRRFAFAARSQFENNSLAARVDWPFAGAPDGAGGRAGAQKASGGAIAFDALPASGGLRGEIPEQYARAADPGERIACDKNGGEAGVVGLEICGAAVSEWEASVHRDQARKVLRGGCCPPMLALLAADGGRGGFIF
jgi:hypothetical protein